MHRYFGFIIISVLLAVVSYAEQPPEKKYVILLADWGKNPPPKEIIKAVAANQDLKVTFAWHSGLKLPEEMRQLVKEKRAELALSFEDEPVMPLIYNTVISTPVAINFSWPEDVWDMVVRAKEEFADNTQAQMKGIYLRSGVFSDKLIPGLKKLGVYWTNFADESGNMHGAFIKDGFLVLCAKKKSFSGAAECWKWINSRPEQFVVIDLGDTNGLDGDFMNELAVYIRQSSSVRTVTPEIVLSKYKDKVQDLGDKPVESDVNSLTRLPLVWYELGVVRKTIENYKNSGSAKLETLEKLREQLYPLYSYKLIESLKKSPSKENVEAFQKKVSAIYAILNLPVDASIMSLPSIQQLRPFSLELSTQSLVVINSESTRPTKNITQFVVTVTTDTVTYFVDLDTSVPHGPLIVDIYMDLNNQVGAGLTKLLPGLDCFLEEADAWEYALRIDKDKALLYRAGRFDPVMIKQFNMQMPWELEIPRSMLRGNPLLWGYQVITATARDKTPGYDVNDFIAKDDDTRKWLLGITAPQLPAVRAQLHNQGNNK